MGAVPLAIMAAGAVVNTVGQMSSANAEAKYYKYLSATAKQNADLTTAAGAATVKQEGTQEFSEMQQLGEKERGVIGEQKTALATGAGIGSRTAQQLISNTEDKAALDQAALRYNTDVKMKNATMGAAAGAFNYQTQATGYEASAKNVQAAAPWNAASTILGSAASTAWHLSK